MASEEIPRIPNGTHFTYLNEGAANIVYRIQTTPSSPQPSLLEEYGEGTPPASEIESDIDVENRNDVDAQIFESKSGSSFRLRCSPQHCAPCTLVCVTAIMSLLTS